MECELVPMNASSFADSVSMSARLLQLIRAEISVECEHDRFQTRAVTPCARCAVLRTW